MTSVNPVQASAQLVSQLLASLVSQTLEQATDLALLNLQIAASGEAGANPEGVGELLDVIA